MPLPSVHDLNWPLPPPPSTHKRAHTPKHPHPHPHPHTRAHTPTPTPTHTGTRTPTPNSKTKIGQLLGIQITPPVTKVRIRGYGVSLGLESNSHSGAQREANKVFGEGRVKCSPAGTNSRAASKGLCTTSYPSRPLMGMMYHTGRGHVATRVHMAQVFACDPSRQVPLTREELHSACADWDCTPSTRHRNGRRGRWRRARRGAPIRRPNIVTCGDIHPNLGPVNFINANCTSLHAHYGTIFHYTGHVIGLQETMLPLTRQKCMRTLAGEFGWDCHWGSPLESSKGGMWGAPQGGIGLLLKKGWISRLVSPNLDDPVQPKLWTLGRSMHVCATLGGGDRHINIQVVYGIPNQRAPNEAF